MFLVALGRSPGKPFFPHLGIPRAVVCSVSHGKLMDWPRILAHITGTVDQELLLRNEYLAAENRILKDQVKGRLLLSDSQKKTLAEIGYRLGRKALADVTNAAKPETILGWYRKLVAQKFDGSQGRRNAGRPRISHAVEQLILRIA